MRGTIAGAGARALTDLCPRCATARPRDPGRASCSPDAVTHDAFPNLFSPLTIGGVTIRNRIMSSGHDTVMARDGLITDQLIAYQEARAKGGAGLIIIQVAGVHPDSPLHVHGTHRRHGRHDPRLRGDRGGGPPSRRGRLRAAVPRRPRDHGHRGRHAGRGPRPVRRAHRPVPCRPAGDVLSADRGDRRGLRDGGGAPRAGRPRRLRGPRGLGLPRLAVPQPAHQPARRRVGRRPGAAPAVPGRVAAGDPALGRTGVRGGRPPVHRRGHRRRPDRGRGARGTCGARRRGPDGLRERDDRDVRVAAGLGPHRAARADPNRLHPPPGRPGAGDGQGADLPRGPLQPAAGRRRTRSRRAPAT